MANDEKSDLSIQDVQSRLQVLGYNLGTEAASGIFGSRTSASLAAFKRAAHLPEGDSLDLQTWQALVDASLDLGDRVLYLHMPHFQGRDVKILQEALSSLGFAVNDDGVFGPTTERALRDFQQNIGLEASGILRADSVLAISRLRHAWEGKRGVILEGRCLGYTRAAEVLETTPLCVFGTGKTTRSIADRISNLALATTPASQVVSAALLANDPGSEMFLVGLSLPMPEAKHTHARLEGSEAAIPQVCLHSFAAGNDLPAQISAILHSRAVDTRRINIEIGIVPTTHQTLTAAQEQQCAIVILDALCLAFGQATKPLG
ncbi:MAG: peptidoglycan-binding protein [Coriobacteriales bacterium]|jgi:peptidoglycan hydrolase-like protein with peptidoglycan-binding domain|nr:peptidoglycan-binding protein [Coriobacteriales bacterium]